LFCAPKRRDHIFGPGLSLDQLLPLLTLINTNIW